MSRIYISFLHSIGRIAGGQSQCHLTHEHLVCTGMQERHWVNVKFLVSKETWSWELHFILRVSVTVVN